MASNPQHNGVQDVAIRYILENSKVIAVVGMSRHKEKDAYSVPLYLLAQGYTVIPVNPSAKEIIGLKCYRSLSEIHTHVDVALIFRPGNQVVPFVKEALKIGVKVIWMQEGIFNEEAALLAGERNIPCIMNRCIYKEHSKLVTSS